MTGYRLPETLAGEIDDLESRIAAYRHGSLSAAELKAYRVPFGVYEQRTRGTYMVRIRCAAGIVTPAQLCRIADIALEKASGRLHVTTRQELQIHDVALEQVAPIIRDLASVGLSTRGGGGNTVRNITASWDAGIAPGEAFDVTPHAVELTSRLIALPDSWLLPRKFKIAFSNGTDDNAYATVNDLGFIATLKDGQRGFRVFVAGGMGRSPQPGQLLHEFVPESDVFEIAEAVKRLFSRYGNRRNRHTARLRFLWNSLGRERFVERYEEVRQELRRENPAAFDPPAADEHLMVPDANNAPHGEAPDPLWTRRYTGAQRQQGLHWVRLPLALGDISAVEAFALVDTIEPLGNDCMRFTQDQNIVLRNIPAWALGRLFDLSRRIAPQSGRPAFFGHSVACAGASTCQLGICLSRNALAAVHDRLARSNIDLDALSGFRLHVSGCPNSCGQHGIADLGFHGKAGRKGEHGYPAYTVVAGGTLDPEKGSVLAQRVGDIPARNLPDFVEASLQHYASRKAVFPTYRAYLEAEGYSYLSTLCETFSGIPEHSNNPEYYRDWGADRDFSLEGRGTGECAAGLFDLIELDLAAARDLRSCLERETSRTARQDALVALAYTAMRALLPAVGETAVSSREVPALFRRHFVDTGLVATEADMVVAAVEAGGNAIMSHADAIIALSLEIERLYGTLDDSLQFRTAAAEASEDRSTMRVDLEKDLRGVACPMNFVKAKMALAQLKPGQTLRVLLDDGAPIENVPTSVEAEGHTIVSTVRNGSFWAVLIRKGGS